MKSSTGSASKGNFQANSLGLVDILGNAWEWTCTAYDTDYGGDETRYVAPTSDAQRVIRGGSWTNLPRLVRSATRLRYSADYRNNSVGFRLAQDLAE